MDLALIPVLIHMRGENIVVEPRDTSSKISQRVCVIQRSTDRTNVENLKLGDCPSEPNNKGTGYVALKVCFSSPPKSP